MFIASTTSKRTGSSGWNLAFATSSIGGFRSEATSEQSRGRALRSLRETMPVPAASSRTDDGIRSDTRRVRSSA